MRPLCIRMIVRNFMNKSPSRKVGNLQKIRTIILTNKFKIWLYRMKIQKDVLSDETLWIRMIIRNYTSTNPSPKVLAFVKHLMIVLFIKLKIWSPWQKIKKDIFSDEALCVRMVIRSFMKTKPSSKNCYLQNILRSFLQSNLQCDFLDWKYRKIHFLTRPAA